MSEAYNHQSSSPEHNGAGESAPERAAPLVAPERLEHIYKSLKFLEPEEDAEGNVKNWRELWRDVGPWENGIELSDSIREALRDYVEKKIPNIIEDFSAFYEVQRESSEELFGLYRDEGMNEEKAVQWLQTRCEPTPEVAALKEFLSSEE